MWGQELLLTHITILFWLCPQKSPLFLQKSPVFPRVLRNMYVVADSYYNSVFADRHLRFNTTGVSIHKHLSAKTNIGLILLHGTTGLRRLIGCLKLQVIFRKRATNCRALLQKMTYEDKASYGSSPLCIF